MIKRKSKNEEIKKNVLFSVRNVGKILGGREVLRDVSFDIYSGDTIHILGENGSGKSTLVKLLEGLEFPDRGEILFRGRDLRGFSDYDLDSMRRKIGYVSQKNGLFSLLSEESASVRDNIYFFLKEVRDIKDGGEINNRINKSLRYVGFEDPSEISEKQRDNLSGGEAKRVAIAREIALEPEIIFYDEPTAGLDPVSKEQIIELIRNFGEGKIDGYKRTSLIVTHMRDVVEGIGGRVGFMHNGELSLYDSLGRFRKSDDEAVGVYVCAQRALRGER